MFQLQAYRNIPDIFIIVIFILEDGLRDDDRSVFSSLSRRTIKLSGFEAIDFDECLIGPADLILTCILVVNLDASQLDILHFVNIFVPGDIEEIIIKEIKTRLEGFPSQIAQKVFTTDIFDCHKWIDAADSASRAFEVISCTLLDFETPIVILLKARDAFEPIAFLFPFADAFVKIVDCFDLWGHVFDLFSVFWFGLIFLQDCLEKA